MSEIITKIKEYMAVKNLSGTSFAKGLGISAVTVNQYLSGKRRVPWEFIQSILDYDEKLSSEWLTRGKGEMYGDANSNESSEQITRELADAKVKVLVQEGLIDKLLNIIGDKVGDKQKLVSEKYESRVG